MHVDSNTYRSLASQIHNHMSGGFWFEDENLAIRHNQIQRKLSKLQSYFSQSAISIERNEASIMGMTPSSINPSPLQTNFTYSANWKSLLMQGDGKSTIQAGIHYSLRAFSIFSFKNTFLQSDCKMDALKISLSGNAKAGLWKDKKLYPDLSISALLDASLLSGNVSTKLGTNNIYAKAEANGKVGTVYAKAKGVLNLAEQTLDLEVGAAGARGEVTCSFNVFGASVTLTGEGSIGSAELGISYSHKNREWEFGSKLGFIAGLGFKVHVNY